MSATITDVDSGYQSAVRKLSALAGKKYVVVGVRSAKGTSRAPGAHLNLAEIATVNEYGSSDGRIPERSFLRGTFDQNRQKYTGLVDAAVSRLTDPAGGSDVDRELGLLGLVVVGDVQQAIAAGVGPANAQSTRDRKGSSKQLVDTGRLRASIDHEVREGS